MNAPATTRTLCWLRGDLRIDDNPALAAALERGGGGCVAVFVASPDHWDRIGWGAPRRRMVLGCLRELGTRLADLGVPLLTVECRFEELSLIHI